MPLFPPFVSRRFLLGGLLPGLLLSGCQPAARPGAGISWLAPTPAPVDTLPEAMDRPPRPAPLEVEPATPAEPEPEPDTLVYARQGCYFLLAGYDTSFFFRRLPRPRPAPGYQLYQTPPNPHRTPLPRHFRLADIQVELFHHEQLSLGHSRYHNNEPRIKCATGLELNAWTYYRSWLEFPQLRTAAGPLQPLNQRLQAHYELNVLDNPEGRWVADAATPGGPIWDFGLGPAELARRPRVVRVDSSLAPEAQWRSPYRLLDTAQVYERYPYAVSLVQLGRHRLLGLTDERQADERSPDSYDEAVPEDLSAYYSLRLGRRAGYDDLFRPALAAALGRAVRPLLLRERQRRYPQRPITAAHWRQLARPRYWSFTRHGWHAVFLADAYTDEDDAHVRWYRLRYQVFVPYARLHAYLRP